MADDVVREAVKKLYDAEDNTLDSSPKRKRRAKKKSFASRSPQQLQKKNTSRKKWKLENVQKG